MAEGVELFFEHGDPRHHHRRRRRRLRFQRRRRRLHVLRWQGRVFRDACCCGRGRTSEHLPMYEMPPAQPMQPPAPMNQGTQPQVVMVQQKPQVIYSS